MFYDFERSAELHLTTSEMEVRVLERAVGSSLLQQMAQRAAVAHAVLLPERGGKKMC